MLFEFRVKDQVDFLNNSGRGVFRQRIDHVFARDAPRDFQAQALPGIFIHNRQPLEWTFTGRPIVHEIPGPDIILMLGTPANTGVFAAAGHEVVRERRPAVVLQFGVENRRDVQWIPVSITDDVAIDAMHQSTGRAGISDQVEGTRSIEQLGVMDVVRLFAPLLAAEFPESVLPRISTVPT